MSDRTLTRMPGTSPRSRRGQSLVEFGLVLPILLVLFLGIADFGRVFAAGITVEAAARNAAEIVAEEYRRNPPGDVPLSEPAPPGDPAYYAPLHELGASTVCSEMRGLAGTTYDEVTRECHVADGDPSTYDWMPVVLICVHDGEDPLCGTPAFGATVPDPQCSKLLAPISPALEGGSEDSRYVEVRICYLFETLIKFPFLAMGDVWLQKDRAFTVADYPVPTPAIPPPPSPPPPTDLPSPEPTASPSGEPTPTPDGTPAETLTPAPTPACLTPVANFTAVPTTGKRPLTVVFTSTSTSEGCAILSYLWTFGDGTTSSVQNPTHVFNFTTGNNKTFIVTLTVDNPSGTSAPASTTILVTK